MAEPFSLAANVIAVAGTAFHLSKLIIRAIDDFKSTEPDCLRLLSNASKISFLLGRLERATHEPGWVVKNPDLLSVVCRCGEDLDTLYTEITKFKPDRKDGKLKHIFARFKGTLKQHTIDGFNRSIEQTCQQLGLFVGIENLEMIQQIHKDELHLSDNIDRQFSILSVSIDAKVSQLQQDINQHYETVLEENLHQQVVTQTQITEMRLMISTLTQGTETTNTELREVSVKVGGLSGQMEDVKDELLESNKAMKHEAITVLKSVQSSIKAGAHAVEKLAASQASEDVEHKINRWIKKLWELERFSESAATLQLDERQAGDTASILREILNFPREKSAWNEAPGQPWGLGGYNPRDEILMKTLRKSGGLLETSDCIKIGRTGEIPSEPPATDVPNLADNMLRFDKLVLYEHLLIDRDIAASQEIKSHLASFIVPQTRNCYINDHSELDVLISQTTGLGKRIEGYCVEQRVTHIVIRLKNLTSAPNSSPMVGICIVQPSLSDLVYAAVDFRRTLQSDNELILAIMRGDCQEVDNLLKYGRYTVNDCTESGHSLLMHALKEPSPEWANHRIYESGASSREFVEVLRENKKRIAKLLISRGADVNHMATAVYESGRKWAINAFRQAVWYHSADIVSLLIDEGIDPMLEPALLGHASMIFNKEELKGLLDRVFPRVPTEGNCDALVKYTSPFEQYIAINCGASNIEGGMIFLQTILWQYLSIYVWNSEKVNYKFRRDIQLTLEGLEYCGMDLKARDPHGRNCLHNILSFDGGEPCETGYMKLKELLIFLIDQKGVDPAAKDLNGQSITDIAFFGKLPTGRCMWPLWIEVLRDLKLDVQFLIENSSRSTEILSFLEGKDERSCSCGVDCYACELTSVYWVLKWEQVVDGEDLYYVTVEGEDGEDVIIQSPHACFFESKKVQDRLLLLSWSTRSEQTETHTFEVEKAHPSSSMPRSVTTMQRQIGWIEDLLDDDILFDEPDALIPTKEDLAKSYLSTSAPNAELGGAFEGSNIAVVQIESEKVSDAPATAASLVEEEKEWWEICPQGICTGYWHMDQEDFFAHFENPGDCVQVDNFYDPDWWKERANAKALRKIDSKVDKIESTHLDNSSPVSSSTQESELSSEDDTERPAPLVGLLRSDTLFGAPADEWPAMKEIVSPLVTYDKLDDSWASEMNHHDLAKALIKCHPAAEAENAHPLVLDVDWATADIYQNHWG